MIVYKSNKRAMRFYKKNGFKKVGTASFKDTECFIMKKTPIKSKLKIMKGGWQEMKKWDGWNKH